MADIGGVLLWMIISCVLLNVSGENIQSLSQSSIDFAKDLYATVVKSNQDENIIISPFSVQVCGAMVYSGAAGRTAEQLFRGLKLTENHRFQVGNSFKAALVEHGDFLSIANKIYLKKGVRVNPEFHDIVVRNFLSEEANLDFEKGGVEENINEWVQNKTNGKIRNFIARNTLDRDTVMFLVNAIYFKAEWTHPFKGVSEADFWLSETEKKPIKMMSQLNTFSYGTNADLDANLVELKYKNSDISMLIILPKSRTGLKYVEDKLPNIDLLKLSGQLSREKVLVSLPKFKIEFSVDLKQILSEMGMSSIFSDNANFSNLLAEDNVKIDDAIHRAFIEVDQLGTEAGATTGFNAIPLSTFEIFTADHPFIFVIKSKTAVLFIGRFVK